MTRKLIVMLALSFALSACESETPENNSNGNTAKPATATQTPAPVSAPSQEASPAAARTELKAGDKVKVTVNGASAQATVVSVDEKAGKVTIRVDGEKQDKTVAIADVLKQ
jgi:sRNA-binding protein